MRLIAIFIIISFSCFSQEKPQNSSIFSNGNWFKICVENDGVYKLTKDDLNNMGIDNPIYCDQVSIFGNSFGMLPNKNSDYRPPEITENSIKLIDLNQNNILEAEDIILFYGKSPNEWVFNSSSKNFEFEQHLYDNKNCYFINVEGIGQSKRIVLENVSTISPIIVNTFNDMAVVENETENLIESGSQWFGQRFDFQAQKSYNFNFPNLSNDSIYLKISAVSRSTSSSRFDIRAQGDIIGNINISPISGNYASDYAKDEVFSNYFLSSSDNLQIELTYVPQISNSTGWLDYIELNAERELNFVGTQMLFRNCESFTSEDRKYLINNVSTNQSIWDITNKNDVVQKEITFSNNQAQIFSKDDLCNEFIIFTNSNYLDASFYGKIENQNLKEISHETEYIIITAKDFESHAYQISDLHSSEDNLVCEVVVVDHIYNEFSSGVKDITALRDFIRFQYLKENSQLSYILLLGDGSYDMKNRVQNNTDFIPTYQSKNSFHPVNSYVSDDYFVMLDEDDGDFLNDIIDLPIGRIPISNQQQASDFVEKLYRYYSNFSLGSWRNNFTFVADDCDNEFLGSNTHMWQADSLANIIDDNVQNFNINKIFLDNYNQISTPGGPRSPDAQTAINEAISKGSLFVNYTGHGGELGWTQERILELSQINQWSNIDKMPIFMTATCKFSRFDSPTVSSAGEQLLLNPKGGAIALLSTTRLVYSNPNYNLNKKFINSIVNNTNLNNQKIKLGDIFLETKVNSGSSLNNRNFTLLGDPALTINFAENLIEITESSVDTMKAFSEVSVSGIVKNSSGSKIENFNGFLNAKVYEYERNLSTLGQQNCTPMPYRDQSSLIFNGNCTVVNGDFNFKFTVPGDISYLFGNAKISMYAFDTTNTLTDAKGYDESLVIGGIESNFAADNQGPQIDLYIDNRNFVDGGLSSENPMLIVDLFDESGINTTLNGIGHQITATLNGGPPVILNDFYMSSLDNYRSGTIEYQFFSLEDGEYTVNVKAWDSFNNSSEKSITFYIIDGNFLSIKNFQCLPNPVVSNCNFYFEHNQSSNFLKINIIIYDMLGNEIKKIKRTFGGQSSRIGPILWNLRDETNIIDGGIYIAKLFVENEMGLTKTKSNRIIIINE